MVSYQNVEPNFSLLLSNWQLTTTQSPKKYPLHHWPEWYLDCDVTVYCDGQQAKDGALCENQHEAGDEQAAIEVGAEARADDDGEWNGQDAHGDVSHSQWHHEEVGDALQVAVEAHGPADQHIAQHGEDSNQQFQDDVADGGDGGDGVVRHGETNGKVTDEEGGNLNDHSCSLAAAELSLLTSTRNIHQIIQAAVAAPSHLLSSNSWWRGLFNCRIIYHSS